MSAAPRPALEERLAALAPRVRAVRVARGAAATVAAALGATAAVLLLDAAVPLPAAARGLFVSVWLTAVGVLVWRWVLVPWRADISAAEVARELEKRLPELGERLRATVEPDPAAGPALRGALAEDAERRTRGADLAGALPTRPAWVLAGVAVLAVCAAGATAALVPGGAERLRRVALPWAKGGGPVAFVVVTSGEPVVRCGDAVTLSAYCERAGRGALPGEAALVRRARPGGAETALPMGGDGAAFHVTVPAVAASFEYCVEAGGARSDWYRVTAVGAADLTAGTRLELTPPAYTGLPARAVAGFADLDAPQFAGLACTFRFSRPVAGAALELRGDGRATPLPLELAGDGLSATGSFPLTAGGTLRLTLTHEGEGKRLRTVADARLAVAPDVPPAFEELSGLVARPRTVRPGAVVPIAFVARDDFQVARAELHFTSDPTKARVEVVPIPLVGTGTERAVGHVELNPLGKAPPGAPLWARVVTFDNRAAPGHGPQATAHPGGWSELRVDANAPPLDEQTVACQHAAVREALAPARAFARRSAATVAALRADTAGLTALAPDHLARLDNLRDPLAAAAAALLELARDADLEPDLRPMGAAARAAAGGDLRAAGAALGAAETNDPVARGSALETARAHFAAAVRALDALHDANEQTARARLDRVRLRAAADALSISAPDPRAALARLHAALADSEALRSASAAAKGAEARRFARRLAALADALRALDRDATATAAAARGALLSTVAREQDELAKRAAAVFGALDTAARLAGTAPPRPDDFLRVASRAAAGQTVEALAELEKQAGAAERLAETFERWAAERADAKLAAKQLAQWQDDALARFRAATRAAPFDKWDAAARAAARAEQVALHAAVRALGLPPAAPVTAARDAAALHVGTAAALLGRDGAGAEPAMRAAVDALYRLAERAPPLPERVAAAAREFEKLRLEFEAAAVPAEQALRAFDRRAPDVVAAAALARQVAPSADRLRALHAPLAALDAPGFEARKGRALAALAAAAADLRDGPPLDVSAALQWARRECERLKHALEGQVPPDARPGEWAPKLAAVAGALEARGDALTRADLEPAARPVRDALAALVPLALTGPLGATEAAALLHDARAALQAAESAPRDATPAEARRRVRAAAAALAALAARLDGTESDYERVTRLAGLRRAAAERPKDAIASAEAGRQMAREADELLATRVGAAGQLDKRRALDLYARLIAKADADRYGTELKALATALDELAGKMADVAELTAGAPPPAPPPAPAADLYLPSAPLAADLRALAGRLRGLHARVTALAGELARRLRPPAAELVEDFAERQAALAAALALHPAADPLGSAGAPLARAATADLAAGRVRAGTDRAALAALVLVAAGSPLAADQRAFAADLQAFAAAPGAATFEQVARVRELERALTALASDCDRARRASAGDDPGGALSDVAKGLRAAATHLREAASKAEAGSAAEAAKYRAAALGALARAAPRLGAGDASTGANAEQGLELRAAERALRAALDGGGADAVAEARRALLAAAR